MSTLVLIPGLVSDRRAWEKVEQILIELGHRVEVAQFPQASSITEMARAVLDLTDQPLIPVGHSMGGRVAMEVARLAPQRVVALVLVATGAHPLAPGESEKREAVIELANEQGIQALCDQWLPPMLAPGIRTVRPEFYAVLEKMVLAAGAEVHERQIRALIARPDAQELLKTLGVATLFVAGEHDSWSTPAQHQAMAELVANAEVAEVKGAGHFLQVEQPEEFSQILTNWLQRHSLAGCV